MSAWLAKGQVAYLEKRYDDALVAWNRALDLNLRISPPWPPLFARQVASMRLDGFREWLCLGKVIGPKREARLTVHVRRNSRSTSAEQLQCARTWAENNFRLQRSPVWRGERYNHDRVRIGYLSADFHQHATSQLMAGVFEHHDRTRFEVTAISVGPNDGSDMRRRIEAAFERFVDAKPQSDAQIAELVGLWKWTSSSI